MEIIVCLEQLKEYLLSKNVSGEIRYQAEHSHLVRVANNSISLNTTQLGAKFYIEIQVGEKLFKTSVVAVSSELDRVKSIIDSAVENIGIMPDIEFLTGLNGLTESEPIVSEKALEMESISSNVGVDIFATTVQKFAVRNVSLSGIFSCGSYEYAIVNTNSRRPLYFKGADFGVELVLALQGTNKEVRASQVGEYLSQLSLEEMWQVLEVQLKIKETTTFAQFTPRPVDVVFGKDALAAIVSLFLRLGLSGEMFEYEMGMLQKSKHKMGDKLWGENVSIIDDPSNESVLFKRPFGLNGLARKATALVNRGVLNGLIYSDKLDCDRFGKQRNNDIEALNPVLLPGDGPANFEDMIASCSSPTLYISFLHYMNCPNRSTGEFTATSRFGTFLIQDGKVVNHVQKVRVLDSLYHLFNNVEWLSTQLVAADTSDTYGARLAGAITLPQFIKVRNVPIVEN